MLQSFLTRSINEEMARAMLDLIGKLVFVASSDAMQGRSPGGQNSRW
ncbi:MAG: hypothetical protein M3243_05940 [Thermoproteota archaeon]|nr:hypothetical protein [Thermoproteota archaeon]